MPGTAARRRAAAAPAARAGAPSTVPASAWTSKTTPTEPPKRWSVSVCAVVDWAPGSRKPPVCSLPNAPTPSTPNPTTASIAATSTRRARRTTKLPTDPVIERPCPAPRGAGSRPLAVVMSCSLAADPVDGAQPGPVGPAFGNGTNPGRRGASLEGACRVEYRCAAELSPEGATEADWGRRCHPG